MDLKLKSIQDKINSYEASREKHFDQSKLITDPTNKKNILSIKNQVIQKMKDPQECNTTKLLKKQRDLLNATTHQYEANRDRLKSSAVYSFNTCFKQIGCNRNAFHKSSIDGNKG